MLIIDILLYWDCGKLSTGEAIEQLRESVPYSVQTGDDDPDVYLDELYTYYVRKGLIDGKE